MKVKIGVVSELLISVGIGSSSPWLRLLFVTLELQLSPSELRSSLKEGIQYSRIKHTEEIGISSDDRGIVFKTLA